MIDAAGVRVYGSAARRYAALVRDVPLLIVSDDTLRARDELLAVRRKGADAAVMLLLEHLRADISRRAALDVYRQVDTYDVRRPHIEAIEAGNLDIHGLTILQRCTYDETLLAHLRQLVGLAGTLVVRSFEELRRIRTHVGTVRCDVVRWVPQRQLPQITPVKRKTIVLWSPDDPGELAALAAFALDQTHRDVVIVAASAPSFPTSFRYVRANDPAVASVLADAACVVDLDTTDPSWACALARAGLPVAAASTSGAFEVLENIAVYEPWSFRSIAGAVAEALGRGPARAREPLPDAGDIRRSLEASQPTPPPRKPLVTLIVPTYNRRARVESQVRRLCMQHYPNLEILVVNDGGEDVSHVAAYDPRVRVVNAERNGGPAAAENLGLREATGEYVEFVADDDVIYPDHVLRCVSALETSGAVVANSNVLLCLDPNGTENAVFNMERFSKTVDLSEAYAYHHVARFLMRRVELIELGGLAEDLFASDVEVVIRIAERYDFVHVPSFTAESWMRAGEQQFSTRPGLDHATELEKMFERHPASGRPYVAALRKLMLEQLRTKSGRIAGY